MKIKSLLPQTKIFLQDNMNIQIVNIKESNFVDDTIACKDYNSMALYLLHSRQSLPISSIKLKDYNYMMDIDVGLINVKTIMSFEASLIEKIIKVFMEVPDIDSSKKEELYLDGASEFMNTVFGLAIPKYMGQEETIKTYPPKKIETIKDANIPKKYSILQEVINTDYGSMSVFALESQNNCNTSKKTALVVDDSLMIVTKMTSLLNELGHNVLVARNGEEAINLYKTEKPDFVTMDVNMPNIDGIEALQSIIAIDPDAKVVMITSDGQNSIMMQSFKEGALDYVLKPITIDKLKKVIGSIYS